MKLENEILIVDDVPENQAFVKLVLEEGSYLFDTASSGEEALEKLKKRHFDLILLDVMMPGIDGFEVCRVLNQDENLKDIPVIFLTARLDVDAITKAFSLGAVDYITKPFNASELLVRVKNHIDLQNAKKKLKYLNLALKQELEIKERRLISEIEDGQKEMIYALTEIVEAASDETGKHIRRVAEYSRILARHHPSLSLEDEEIIAHAAPMHDLGKISIPPEILHKTGKLTDEEHELLKGHTTLAHEFFKGSKRRLMVAADIIATQHHERWDGDGYPTGLEGENIHIYGRIVALADVFDALTHQRKYKEAWPVESTIDYIKERAGSQFDPEIVDIFINHIVEILEVFKTED
ncbi:MAG TPA: response regulator [Thiomicrospira sp.]|nr:response regulator [Thiomicrospira sp.]